MNEPGTPFLRRTHQVVLGAAAVSLLSGVAWAIFAEDLDLVFSNRADGYSVSAIGHGAFLELLDERGFTVHRSRFRSERRVGPGGLLILAEPPPSADDAEPVDLARMVVEARNALLVLPRRVPSAGDEADPRRHLRGAEELEEEAVGRVLRAVDPFAHVVRVERAETDGTAAPVEWTENTFGLEPDLPRPQLVQSENLIGLIECDDGILVGELRGWLPERIDDEIDRVLVLSDPDLLANHGLDRGENAALALALVESAAGARGRVVVDEVAHGFRYVPSPWRELFRRPLVFATLHGLALALLLIRAALVRVGRPRPAPPGRPEGKQALLDNAAVLLDSIGASSHALRRYLDATLARIAARLHAPAGLPRGARAGFIAGRLRDAQAAARLRDLDVRVREARLGRRRDVRAHLELARRIHRFRREILDGA